MKKLDYYEGDCFEFYKTVIEAKRNPNGDPNFKDRIRTLDDNIREFYRNFDVEFHNNSLESLNSADLEASSVRDLSRLYSYRNRAIQQLLVDLTTDDSGRILNTCQNCTINEIDSLDHYLPKSEFVEFNVNPKNLFPCCTVCNRKKSLTWRENGQRIYLNLYLDPLPKLQYLHVELGSSDSVLEAHFYMEKPDDMDQDLFDLIYSHYDKLDLLKRFRKNSDHLITNIINDVSTYLGKLSYEEIFEISMERIIKNRTAFGYNYWVSILELALLESDVFKEQFE